MHKGMGNVLAEACKRSRFKPYFACMYIYIYIYICLDCQTNEKVLNLDSSLSTVLSKALHMKSDAMVLHSPLPNAYVLPYIPIAFSHCHG